MGKHPSLEMGEMGVIGDSDGEVIDKQVCRVAVDPESAKVDFLVPVFVKFNKKQAAMENFVFPNNL